MLSFFGILFAFCTTQNAFLTPSLSNQKLPIFIPGTILEKPTPYYVSFQLRGTHFGDIKKSLGRALGYLDDGLSYAILHFSDQEISSYIEVQQRYVECYTADSLQQEPSQFIYNEHLGIPSMCYVRTENSRLVNADEPWSQVNINSLYQDTSNIKNGEKYMIAVREYFPSAFTGSKVSYAGEEYTIVASSTNGIPFNNVLICQSVPDHLSVYQIDLNLERMLTDREIRSVLKSINGNTVESSAIIGQRNFSSTGEIPWFGANYIVGIVLLAAAAGCTCFCFKQLLELGESVSRVGPREQPRTARTGLMLTAIPASAVACVLFYLLGPLVLGWRIPYLTSALHLSDCLLLLLVFAFFLIFISLFAYRPRTGRETCRKGDGDNVR